jgi:hypothetical protein
MSKMSSAKGRSEKSNFTGGATFEELSELRNKYKINHDYPRSINLDSKMLNKTNVLEFLRNGLDVQMILKNNPIVFQVQDQATLEIFEFFGADSSIKNYDLKTLDPLTFSAFMFRINWIHLRDKFERISQLKTPTLLTEVEDIEIFEFLQSVNYRKIDGQDIHDKDKFTIIMNYINYGTNREDAFKLAKIIKDHFEKKDYYNQKFGTQLHPKMIRYFVEILKEYPLDESKLSRLYEIIKKFDPKKMNEYSRRALDYIDSSWTTSVIDAYVRNLYKFGTDSKEIDTYGRCFYEELMKQPRKNKMIIEIIDSIHTSIIDVLDKETAVNEKKKTKVEKTTSVEKASAIKVNSEAISPKKIKTPNSNNHSFPYINPGIKMLKIVSINFFDLFGEFVEFDGVNHKWVMISFCEEFLIKNLQYTQFLPELGNEMADFLALLESNSRLIVRSSDIGKELLPFLYGEDLTGLTIATLFAQGLLRLELQNENDYSNLIVEVESRVLKSINNVQMLLSEFLRTVLSFKLDPESEFYIKFDYEPEVKYIFNSFDNDEIETPTLRKRKTKKQKGTKESAKIIERESFQEIAQFRDVISCECGSYMFPQKVTMEESLIRYCCSNIDCRKTIEKSFSDALVPKGYQPRYFGFGAADGVMYWTCTKHKLCSKSLDDINTNEASEEWQVFVDRFLENGCGNCKLSKEIEYEIQNIDRSELISSIEKITDRQKKRLAEIMGVDITNDYVQAFIDDFTKMFRNKDIDEWGDYMILIDVFIDNYLG